MDFQTIFDDIRKKTVEGVESLLGINKDLIGVYIGQSSVKIAEVKSSSDGKRRALIRYATHPLSEGTIIEDEIQNEQDLINALRHTIEKGEFTTKAVTLGLFGPKTTAKKLKLAGGTPEEIENQVFWESEQYTPFDLEDGLLSYDIVGENKGGGIDVVIAAASKNFVNTMKEIVEKVDLRIKIIDINQLALVNVFEFVHSSVIKDSTESFLLLNISGQKTDFIVYSDRSISFSKEIYSGGLAITEEIQRQMGVTYKEAEDLKTKSDENGNLPEEILEIIDEVIKGLFIEIKETLSVYKGSSSDESFKRCYLSGGSAQIPGILEGLNELLGFEVVILNPFDKIGVDTSKYSEEELRSISFAGIPVIGLGMRQLK